jgi:Tfp pilus assembly protein PilX
MCAYGTDRQPRGAALVIVMLVMAVLLLAGTTFMTISSTESQIALNERVSVQASLLAEAAIHKTIAQLNANPGYAGESNTALGGGLYPGTFTVTVSNATVQPCGGTTAKDLVGTGSVDIGDGKAQVQIAATVDQVSYPYRWGAFAAVPNLIVSSSYCFGCNMIFGDDRTESELWLQDNSTTDSYDSSLGQYDTTMNRGTGGNIGGNGDVTLGNSVNIQGSARAGDALHKGSGDVISGGQVESFSPDVTSPGEPLPSVSPPASRPLTIITDLPSPAAGSSYSVTGGILTVTSGVLNLPSAGSPYYFTSMTFSSGTALTTSGGPVTIYATGMVTVNDNVTFGAASGTAEATASSNATQLRIILKSDGANWLDTANFSAGQNFRLYGSLYGKSTNIMLNDGAHVYGSIVGRTVVLHQSSAIHYDHAMLNHAICRSDGKFSIRRGTWREVIP